MYVIRNKSISVIIYIICYMYVYVHMLSQKQKLYLESFDALAVFLKK